MEVDYTAWDSTVSKFDLELTHYIYRRLYPAHPNLARILSYHSTSVWSYRNGCRYTLTGTRVSGDSDTTVGNSILHWIYCHVLLEGLYREWDIAMHFEVAGDDGVIGCPVERVALDVLVECGKVVKSIYRVDPNFTQFCSGVVLPIQIDGHVRSRLYRLPGRSVGRIGFAPDSIPRRAAYYVLEQRALAEMYACAGVPINHTLARSVHSFATKLATDHWKSDRDVQRRLRLEQTVPMVQEVCPLTRARFAHVFGITPSIQREVERDVAHQVLHRGMVHNAVLNYLADNCS